MTSSEFINVLKQSGNTIEIFDQYISDIIDIQFNITAIGVVIKKCTFTKAVIFENVNLNCGLKFIDCSFLDTLSVNSCNASNYDNAFNFDGYHIDFSNTKINGLYFNGNNNIERGVRICNKSVIGKLQVASLFSNKGSFAIHDSIIERQFDISQGELSGSLEVRSNSIIKSKIRFENVITGSLTFTDSNFEKDIHIWAGNIKSLTFNDGVFEEDLNITAVPISEDVTIIGTQFKKSIIFNINDSGTKRIGTLNKVYIASGKFGEQLIINGNNAKIEDLSINISKQLEGTLHFSSCKFLKTKLLGSNYNGNIVFNHCLFNNLSFDFFYNYATISIISAKAFGDNSEISITHSNLGKTHFYNMFFNSFEKISIFNSVLTEIITSNVKWFEPKKLNQSLSHEYAQKREIYRQLKSALEKQGNKIDSLIFKSLEISAFKNELFSTRKWFRRLFNNDRFILWVGQTNSFGLNWIKPSLLIMGFGLFFFLLIVIGISDKLDYCFNLNLVSIKFTIKEFYNYSYALPQLMNPVHNIEKIFPEGSKLGFAVHLLDYILKIFVAFFIFQIISAFRKFMK